MYDTVQHNVFEPFVANRVSNTVARYHSYTRNCQTNEKQRKPHLFPPAAPGDFDAIHTLSPLPKKQRSKSVHQINNGLVLEADESYTDSEDYGHKNCQNFLVTLEGHL